MHTQILINSMTRSLIAVLFLYCVVLLKFDFQLSFVETGGVNHGYVVCKMYEWNTWFELLVTV